MRKNINFVGANVKTRIMAEEKNTYINPNHPVYFSYSGNNEVDNELEKPVEELRKRLDKANIDYRDYKVNGKSTFTYRRPMMDSEEEIGRGDIVVVVFSIKYLNSWHCMYEWYNIVHYSNDYKKRIFPIYLDDIRDRLKDEIRTSKLDKILENNFAKLADKEVDYPDQLTEADKFVLKLGRNAFKTELHLISKYFHDNTVPKLEKFDYDVLLNQIKLRIDELTSKSNFQHNVSSFPASEQTKTTSRRQLSFDTRTDIVKRDTETEKIKGLFDNNQIVNLIGVGGCGKTTITECYVNRYRDEYNNTLGVFINKEFYTEFAKKCLSKMFGERATVGMVTRGSLGDLFSEVQSNVKPIPGQSLYNEAIADLEEYPKDGEKYNLLIIDINEFADYGNIENALDDLRDNNRLRNWKILVVSREKMESALVHFDPMKLETDKVAFPVLEEIFNKYLKRDQRYSFTREQLEKLFLKLGHLPILIEHLAYYLRDASEARSFDFIWKYLGDGFEDHKMWFRKYEKIREFLSLLMRLDSLDEISNKIVRLLVIWPTEYYSAKFIRQFMSDGDDSNPRFVNAVDDGLNTLVDKCVLDSMDKEKTRHYKIHDIISGQFRKQIFEDGDEDEMIRSYSSYANIVKSLFKSGKGIGKYSDMGKCIDNTPLKIFGIGSTKDYSVYEDWKFLRGLAQLKRDDTKLSELSYKAYLLKKFYNNSGEEIYHKVYGEYKNVSSHLMYNEWLSTKSKYNNDFPKEESDDYGKFIVISVNDVVFKMRKVKHGSFQMGSNDGYLEQPVHQVTLANDFYIGEVQVTQQLWMAVMGENNNPSWKRSKNHPVEYVTWYDCMDFIIKLNELTKHKEYQFRLPTEAEWEYAARSGGKNHKYSTKRGGFLMGSEGKKLHRFAWFIDNSENTTHPVASGLCPNELGLYDMSGNVWEWCQDWEAYYSSESVINPQGPSSGKSRVLRGGSWNSDARSCRVSYRYMGSPDSCRSDIGFRLSLSSKHP